MGKIRSQKFKRVHKPAIPVSIKGISQDKPKIEPSIITESTKQKNQVPLQENPFKAIKISDEHLKANIHFNNVEKEWNSVLPTTNEFIKSKKEAVKNTTNKLDKRRLRREMFLKKLETTRTIVTEKIAAKKRAEVPIIGDVNPMKQALDDLASLSVPAKKRQKKTRLQKKVAKRNKNTEKLTSKQMRKTHSTKVQKHKMNEILKIQKLIKNPSYKGNASDTIRNVILANISSKKL